VDTREWYRWFADVEAAGSSPIYERTSHAVADDAQLIERLRTLPSAKRQPNLLFASCRYLAAPFGEPAETLEFVHRRWSDVSALMMERSTQTNEPARTGTFAPLLAQLDAPLALIEVGPSAGLCLYPDRYRIRFDDAPPIGPPDSRVTIDVETYGGVPIPHHDLDVGWRAGIDLNPLDVRDPEDLAWLSACIWPEHTHRQERLAAAAAIVAADPPDLVRGDLVAGIDELLAGVPPDLTPVVFHSAVLGYLTREARAAFAGRMRAHPNAVWISNEGPGVMEGLTLDLAPPDRGNIAYFIVGLGGEQGVAISSPHGAWLKWPDAAPSATPTPSS
jgi:hypothetical protein